MSDFVPNLSSDQGFERMAWRANHIYLLMIGCLHLSFGIYWRETAAKRLAIIQIFGSILLFLAAGLLLAAFILEPASGSVTRPITTLGAVSTLGGTLLSAGAVWFEKKASPD